MPRPLRIFEGRFGRLVLAEAAADVAAVTRAEPLILFKVDGADCAVQIGEETLGLTRDDTLLANAGQPVRHAGGAHGGASRVVEFHPSLDWLRAVFPAVFEDV